MRSFAKARLAVGIVCVLALVGATMCFADVPATEAGDPGGIAPGMSTLEPTPDILSGFVTVLVTVVSLALT